MRKIITFTLALLALTTFANGRNDKDVILHQEGRGIGFEQVYVDPPPVKTPGKVAIDGCLFQGGANVKIEAGKVEFVGKFTAELGSKVEFTQFTDE